MGLYPSKCAPKLKWKHWLPRFYLFVHVKIRQKLGPTKRAWKQIKCIKMIKSVSFTRLQNEGKNSSFTNAHLFVKKNLTDCIQKQKKTQQRLKLTNAQDFKKSNVLTEIDRKIAWWPLWSSRFFICFFLASVVASTLFARSPFCYSRGCPLLPHWEVGLVGLHTPRSNICPRQC